MVAVNATKATQGSIAASNHGPKKEPNNSQEGSIQRIAKSRKKQRRRR
jgi:hypothetical protein